MAPELRHLLTAAFRLVDAGDSLPAETVRVGNKEFRVFAEQHEKHGWILLLIHEPDRTPCDYTLRTWYGLTDREIEVARLLTERYSNREIAGRLGVTVWTAGRHTEHVMRKMGVSSRKEVRAKLQSVVSAS